MHEAQLNFIESKSVELALHRLALHRQAASVTASATNPPLHRRCLAALRAGLGVTLQRRRIRSM